MNDFIGFVAMDDVIRVPVLTIAAGVPADADSLPTYRVYGDGGLLAGGTGSLSLKDSGAITGASNTTPINITAASHKLQSGMRINVSGVGGNTAANGTFTITASDSNTFSLNGSVGNGAYTSGGTWHVAGLYDAVITPATTGGYAVNEFFDLLVTAVIGGNTSVQTFRFGVV